MKQIICLITFVLVLCSAQAQRLVPINNFGSKWGEESVSTKNKPNGYIYRLRKDVQKTDLPQLNETKNMELYIAEPIDLGWLTLYRLPTSSDREDYVVVVYDQELNPLHVLNLGDITGSHNLEVQDVRWDADNHNLLFNMAHYSYSDGVGGKCSKLYSYSVEQRRLMWETDYLVSNDIFTLNSKYVFCSYGFTNEKKFLYMLDKQTGKVYSKLPLVYKVQYMELQRKNGRELLYVVDSQNSLITYAVSDQPAAAKSAANSREPKVLTVVYATSSDGFMNVREEPTTKSKILTQLYGQMHGLGSGVLRENGDTWSKVSVGETTGWVYNKTIDYQSWYTGEGTTVLVANRDNMPVYTDNYADEGGLLLFTTVKKGTILADMFEEHNGYYELRTGHDYLFIKKEDARLEKK